MPYAIMRVGLDQYSLMKKRKHFLRSGTAVASLIMRVISAHSKAERIATFFDLPGRSRSLNSNHVLGLLRSNWRFMLYQGQRSLVVLSSNKPPLILNLQTGLIRYGKLS